MGALKPYIEVPTGKLDPHGQEILAIGPNPVKDHVRGFHFSPNFDARLTAGAVVGANGAAELEFVIDSQGHFDWTHIVGQSTGAYTVLFSDVMGNDLSNRPIHNLNIVGNARRPFKLPEPYFFNVGATERRMIAHIRDLSGSENTVRLNLYGRRYYVRENLPDVGQRISEAFGSGYRCASYFLTVKEANQDGTPPTIAGNGVGTFTFAADHDSDTQLMKMMVSSTGVFSFNIREKDSDRRFSNEAIHSDVGLGSAQFPFMIADGDGWLLRKNKELLIDITDLSGNTNTIYLALAARLLRVR